jgi:hypothetical protein
MRGLILVGLLGAVVGCGDDDRGTPPTGCNPPLTQGEVDVYCYGLGFPRGCSLSCDENTVVEPVCDPSPSCGDAGVPTCVCP